ncbi:hypothetical protein ABEB36_002867 [Hypothenemus hampei]|uniref:Uncharacterized protein n=1 Tax=Hypothenemus hampei TaxID=57062 RepID=A0ABD1F785_HYPHA
MSERAKTVETSPTSVDVEKQDDATNTDSNDNNNHFFEEKVKERAPPGINGSLVFLYALFFTVFTVGCININKCPLNRLIPIYLVLAGFLGITSKFLSKFDNKYCFWIMTVFIFFDVIWHGVGTYVVYREYQPSYVESDPNYCNRTAYLIAFWTLTIEYTLLLLFLLLSCCYMIMRRDFRT